MTDTTAKVRAKGCDATGITEEIASSLYANKGLVEKVGVHFVEVGDPFEASVEQHDDDDTDPDDPEGEAEIGYQDADDGEPALT